MKRLWKIGAALALLGTAAISSGQMARAAGGTTTVVTEDNITRQAENTPPTNHWVLYTRNAGNGAFRSGPATPPLGVGSFEMTTPTGADKATLFNYDHIGTKLSDINAISYSTYRTTVNLQQVTALNMEVDFNGPNVAGGFTTLVFEPVYNTTQGTVLSGQWQDWDAYNGGAGVWWSTKDIPGVCAFNCFVPWSTIVANNANATILGGFGVNQGSGNPGLISAVDALTLGTGGQSASSITYNFDPFVVATNKDDCKNGGWQNLRRADGSKFKNQGDCVSYANNGR